LLLSSLEDCWSSVAPVGDGVANPCGDEAGSGEVPPVAAGVAAGEVGASSFVPDGDGGAAVGVSLVLDAGEEAEDPDAGEESVDAGEEAEDPAEDPAGEGKGSSMGCSGPAGEMGGEEGGGGGAGDVSCSP